MALFRWTIGVSVESKVIPSGFGAKTSTTMDPAQVTRVVPFGLSEAVRRISGVRHFVKRKGPRTFVHICDVLR